MTPRLGAVVAVAAFVLSGCGGQEPEPTRASDPAAEVELIDGLNGGTSDDEPADGQASPDDEPWPDDPGATDEWPGRVSARMRGPLNEEFLESYTRVVGAGSEPDTDLGGVALMLTYYGRTPIIYTDYGAFRIDLSQELLPAAPPVDDSYTTIGEFSVTGRIGFVDHRYDMVWMPGSTDASGPHRLRVSGRVEGELQKLLVQAWPEEPSPPEQLKPARG
ncbi:hypothetical protein [Nocardioides sp.]|uniref:hypothetical protein n=1 Tax=Nocardioides sp. TaxID=35761 RepID=UPI0035B23215